MIEDKDDPSMQIIIDGEDRKKKYTYQSLGFRVGPVFETDSDEPTRQGLWIEYQERYMDSPMVGPVLLSREEWIHIRDFIDAKFKL